MDVKTEKLCLEEIYHLVCDQNAKVNISEVSNNWNVPFKDSETVLLKWVDEYKGNKDVIKEYLVRGIDANDNCFISVVSEQKIHALEKKYAKFCKTLYSIELDGGCGKRLDLPQKPECKMINLPLKSDRRDLKVPDLPVSPEKPIKKEPKDTPSTSTKKPSSLFGSVPANKEKNVKTSAEKKESEAIVKEKPKSPVKKESPKKKEAPSKTGKIATGKSAISTFFSSKPAAKSSSVAKPVAKTIVKEEQAKEEKKKIETKAEETKAKNNKKRTLSVSNVSDDECIPGTLQEKPSSKKPKRETVHKKEKAAANRSRIMRICDSSSDEDEPSSLNKVVKKEDSNKNGHTGVDDAIDVCMKENKTPPKESNLKSEPMDDGVPKKRRFKKKQTVTRTYEDDEGYIRTVHETEEVSCSEDEPEIVNTSNGKSTAIKSASTEEKTTDSASSKGKKKPSPPNGKKQGSILSFFSKK